MQTLECLCTNKNTFNKNNVLKYQRNSNIGIKLHFALRPPPCPDINNQLPKQRGTTRRTQRRQKLGLRQTRKVEKCKERRSREKGVSEDQ